MLRTYAKDPVILTESLLALEIFSESPKVWFSYNVKRQCGEKY